MAEEIQYHGHTFKKVTGDPHFGDEDVIQDSSGLVWNLPMKSTAGEEPTTQQKVEQHCLELNPDIEREAIEAALKRGECPTKGYTSSFGSKIGWIWLNLGLLHYVLQH